MKYIITEDQNLRLKFLRRKGEIISHMKNTISYIYPCDFDYVFYWLQGLKSDLMDSYFAEWLHSEDEDKLWQLIMNEFGDELKKYYFDKCKRF